MKLFACPNTQIKTVKSSTYAYIPGQSYPNTDIFQSSYYYPGASGDYPAAPISGFFYGFQSTWYGGSANFTGSNSAPCPNVNFAGSSRKSHNGPTQPTGGMQLWINTPSTQPIMVDAYAVPGGIWTIATTGDYFSNHEDGVNVAFVDGHAEFRHSDYISVRYRQMWW